MDVQAIMSRKLVLVSLDDPVSKVREIFNTWRFHHLLVVDGRRLVGVVSDRDLLKNLSPFLGRELAERAQDVALLDRKVHQIMTRKLITATREMAVENAMQLMVSQQVSCLPVINEKQEPVGIVTWKDMFRVMVPGLQLPPLRRDEEIPPVAEEESATPPSITRAEL